MAEEVATWRDIYNIDGIDLDIEAGAGDRKVSNYGSVCVSFKAQENFFAETYNFLGNTINYT